MQGPLTYPGYPPPAIPPFSAAYVVMFELTQPSEKYGPFMQELMAHGKWMSYMKGSYIVVRRDTLVEFTSKLRPLMFTPDRLLIMPARGPFDGWMPQEAWTWLERELQKLW